MFYEKERSPTSTNLYLVREVKENLNYARHMHRSLEIIDVLEGEIRVILGSSDREYVITPDSAAMILPYQVHAYRTVGYSRSIMTIFSADYVKTFYDMIRGRTAESPIFPHADRELSLKLLNADGENLLLIKSCLYAICAEFCGNAVFCEHTDTGITLFDRIIEYIELHYTEKITLKQIADAYNYNYRYISNFFNSRVGINFKRFLNEYRIHEACCHLTEENRSITEVARLSGYDTLRSFNREFLSITGMTPSEFKKTRTRMK